MNDNINRNSWKDRLRKYIYGTAKYNEEIYSNSYDEFHQNVDSIFNNCEERLLKISVFEDDVWEKLSHFMGIEISKESFPWENEGYLK